MTSHTDLHFLSSIMSVELVATPLYGSNVFIIFFLSGFSLTNIYDSQDSRGRGRVSI